MGALTREAFAAMLGTPAVPLCETIHRCGRVATHYVEAIHQCLMPAGQTKYVYAVCAEVARVVRDGTTVICQWCHQPIPQAEYTRLAGQVEVTA